MSGPLPYIPMTDAHAVAEILREGAAAGRSAKCRTGSIDRIHAPGRLIATGDLHDNPIHLLKLLEVAGLTGEGWVEGQASGEEPSHLVLHELIHGDNLMNGMDLSYRVLTRAADL